MVTLDDPVLGKLLLSLGSLCVATEPIIDMGEAALRTFFERACASLGLTIAYRPYSIRRGGATHDYMLHANLGKTVLRGRWGSLTTARIYINDGLAVLSELGVDARAAGLIQQYATLFCTFLQSL